MTERHADAPSAGQYVPAESVAWGCGIFLLLGDREIRQQKTSRRFGQRRICDPIVTILREVVWLLTSRAIDLVGHVRWIDGYRKASIVNPVTSRISECEQSGHVLSCLLITVSSLSTRI